MELVDLSYCGVLLVGIIIGYILSRKQDERPVLPVPTSKEPETMVEDEMFRCLHTPEELKEIEETRFTTDGRKS